MINPSNLSSAFQNQFLSGGLVLMLVGALIALLRKTPEKLWHLLRRQFSVSIEITSKSVVFDWFMEWFETQPYSGKARDLSVIAHSDLRDPSPFSTGEEHTKRIYLIPGTGSHLFLYKRHLIWLQRSRDKMSDNDRRSVWFFETFTLSTLGRSRKLLEDLLQATVVHASRERVCVKVYVAGYESWYSVRRMDLRDLSSVILPEGMQEAIVHDLQEFLDRRSWYRQMGLPYRRGYLLYGTPGSGKSSLVHALASQFKFDVYVLTLSGMSDQRLMTLLAEIPDRSVVLMEDIDAAFHDRELSPELKRSEVTFSGLLNALDGLMTGQGRILFATTNHRDKLDEALIRPGRIDRQLELVNANRYQLTQLFLRFYPEEIALADRFADSVGEYMVSMAAVQEHFLRFKDGSMLAVENVPGLLKSYGNGKYGGGLHALPFSEKLVRTENSSSSRPATTRSP
jgi:chaperone BCS1